MSTGMSKQDEELLDQKIARIRKKNEEILRRKQEIEEDKKFAEQNNAMVQLRPSTDDWPRERTPALRPSQREMQSDKDGGDADQMIHEPVNRNKERNQPSSRGRENTGKRAAPPPDPVSFLADPDRDYYSMDKEPPSFTRGNSRNFRDFKRGGPRRGRGSRGAGYHNHHGNFPSSSDDAWREERYRIDEARINRQKSADGKWRREWDNEKINLESQDEPISPSYTSPSGVSSRQDRWKQPRNFESGDSHESPNSRGRGFSGGGGGMGRGGRGSRGRGSYKIYPEHSPPGRSGQHGLNQNVNTSKYYSGSPPMPPKESYSFPTGTVGQQSASPNSNVVPSPNARFVTNVGDSFKIVVPNVSSDPVSRDKDTGKHMSRKGRVHQQNSSEIGGYRQRLSQSQSSYSEDEYQKADQEVFHKSKPNRQYISVSKKLQSPNDNEGFVPEEEKTINSSKSQKPPLPPFRTSLPKSKISIDVSKEPEDGDISWEDVTTSGTESIGDDHSSFTSSPRKFDSLVSESDSSLNYDPGNPSKDPKITYTPEDFILLVPSETKYPENVTNSNSVNLNYESVTEAGLDTGAVSLKSENTVTDPVDVYTPDDFIKLVPSDIVITENNTDDNCSTEISSPNKEVFLELDCSLDNESDCQSKDPADIYKPEDFIRLVPPSEVVDKSQDLKLINSTNENSVPEGSQETLKSTSISESVTEVLKDDNTISNESITNRPESDEIKVNSVSEENSDQAESDTLKTKADADNSLLKPETFSNDIPKQLEIPVIKEDNPSVILSSDNNPLKETG